MRYLWMMLLAILPMAALAETEFEKWVKSQEQGAAQVKEEFRKYKDENDRQFAEFLKAQWREFDTFKGVVRDPKPKPKVLPTAKPAPTDKPAPTKKPVSGVTASPIPLVILPTATPAVIQLPPAVATPRPALGAAIPVPFYGNTVAIPYVPAWKQRQVSGALSAEAMSAFWAQIGTSNFEPALLQLQLARKTLVLDDWSYLTLVRSYVQSLQPGSVTDQNLLLWFFMIKSGYDVRCAYMGSDLYVFVAVTQQVYGTKYMQVKDTPYYAVLAADRGESMKSYYTYDAKYPGNLRSVDLRVKSLAFTQPLPVQRELHWAYAGKKYQITVPYDRRAVDFLSAYPQADIKVQFSSDLSPLSRPALLRQLRPMLTGMSEEQSVNFLLGFVQKAFDYKTDEDQFGREKYFFGEEILYYPYSDCEDRAVFFAWLVKELTGLEVVGLSYPGHIAAAVKFRTANPRGDSVSYNGGRYMVTDPTYIGASLGMTQPPLVNSPPKVIVW